MNMQLAKDEQKILEAAIQSTEIRKPGLWVLILCLLGGALIIIAGVREYWTEGPTGLKAIGFGVISIGNILIMHEYLKFRNAVFSLIKKLQAERAKGQ